MFIFNKFCRNNQVISLIEFFEETNFFDGSETKNILKCFAQKDNATHAYFDKKKIVWKNSKILNKAEKAFKQIIFIS